jgi:hypothetical protein
MNPKIKARVRIENRKLASKANASRLIVRGTKDISKTMHVRGFTFTPEYRELYVVMLESEGYIWREIKHGCGINGHHPTLRELVSNTVCQGYEIEVLPEPVPLSELNPLASGFRESVLDLRHRLIDAFPPRRAVTA